MKKYHVEITAVAAAELREAYRWIQEDSPARAVRWRAGLRKQIERLALRNVAEEVKINGGRVAYQ